MKTTKYDFQLVEFTFRKSDRIFYANFKGEVQSHKNRDLR